MRFLIVLMLFLVMASALLAQTDVLPAGDGVIIHGGGSHWNILLGENRIHLGAHDPGQDELRRPVIWFNVADFPADFSESTFKVRGAGSPTTVELVAIAIDAGMLMCCMEELYDFSYTWSHLFVGEVVVPFEPSTDYSVHVDVSTAVRMAQESGEEFLCLRFSRPLREGTASASFGATESTELPPPIISFDQPVEADRASVGDVKRLFR